MSRTYHHGKDKPNRAKARDYRKIGRAVIRLTEAQLEKEAKAEHRRKLRNKNRGKKNP